MAKSRGLRLRRWLTPVERGAVVARFRAGARVAEVMAEFGLARTSAYRIRDEAELVRRRVAHSPHRLSFEERERILVGVCWGESDSEIARVLGRHRSTVGREIRRCGVRRRDYRPLAAERVAHRLAGRPKRSKFSACPRLVAAVEQGLEEGWSPEQISARLRVEYPDDQEMRISHETIYQSLFVQSRGELRRQLTACLRSGRKARKPRGRVDHRGRIPGIVPISERPAEVEDRAVPGHWEGDLIIGKAGRSAVATLVERHTRYVLLARRECHRICVRRDRTEVSCLQSKKRRSCSSEVVLICMAPASRQARRRRRREPEQRLGVCAGTRSRTRWGAPGSERRSES